MRRARCCSFLRGFAARAGVLAAVAVFLAACGPGGDSPGGGADDTGRRSEASDAPASESGASGAGVAGTRFLDITDSSGIDFVHTNDASEARLLPETMGAGAAFFDYDRDGRPDLYLVNGGPLVRKSGRDAATTEGTTGALYRNLGEGRFEDVTAGSGLDVPLYGMGAAVGDFDNDGWIDLVVTGLGRCRVFRNRRDGTFEDLTVQMGLSATGFATSAAFLDYDRDGFLDLFVCRYVEWTPESDLECRPDGIHRIYCTPESYPPTANLLFRNHDGRRFADVSAQTGIAAHLGKALGVVPLDVDDDGWPDLVVANDTVRNFLFRNRGDGRFDEIGERVGIAYSESGAPRGGMGVDAGDLDGDGRVDVVVTNFTHEMVALFRATATGGYVDDAAHLGLGFPTLLTLGFGVLLEDLDGDGLLDVVVANGHIEPRIAEVQRGQTHAQRPQIFFGSGGGRLVLAEGEAAIGTALVARGLAAADIDGDGDPDLLFTQNGRAARLFRNEAPRHDWLRVVLEGAGWEGSAAPGAVRPVHRSSRTAFGAVVTVHGERGASDAASGGAAESSARDGMERFTLRRALVSGRSYLSAHDPALTFGLGDDARVDSLVVVWPSGLRQVVGGAEVGTVVLVREPEPKVAG